jgi:tRNA(fMet)-specific endonuclease VapC
LRIIYDTNILLQILRDDRSISKLQTIYNLYDVEEFISLVTVAEIRSLSIQFQWGANRRAKMEELLFRLAILDINAPEIIDRYVEIDCYSKGKHLTRASNFSAIKMGKNDLWIAAGTQDQLYLGNIEIQRDWGWAEDYETYDGGELSVGFVY